MTLRRRLALGAAAAGATAIATASGLVYVVVRGELRGRLDDELRATASSPRGLVAAARGALPPGVHPPGFAPRDPLGLPSAYVALVGPGGTVVGDDGDIRLPVTGRTRAVAQGAAPAFFSDARVDGAPVRVFTSAAPGVSGFALQVARPLADVERTLDRLALVLALVSAGGVGLAALLGRVVARAALVPVARLTGAVEHVAATGDLSRRVAVGDGRGDEIARLARSFDAMLAALESSVGRQRQLVADASHELRTPLTSLRTNIEVLARSPALPDEERRRLLADVVEQLEELGALVGDVVELAREQEPALDFEVLRFDELVTDAVARAQRRAGAPRFATALAPCLVRGVAARLDRAVANLLDNAAKWSPPGAAVDVALRDGELSVRDRGPGIPPEHLPHVFERFYRAPGSRGMAGSGLGLAIVRQVAELHGGRAEAVAAEGGGALLRLTVPVDTDGHSCKPD